MLSGSSFKKTIILFMHLNGMFKFKTYNYLYGYPQLSQRKKLILYFFNGKTVNNHEGNYTFYSSNLLTAV